MTIVGFNFEKILSEKKSLIKGPVKVNSDVNIVDIVEEKFKVGKSEDLLKFNFEFKVNYGDIGSIEFEGHVLYLDEPSKVKDILADWKKNKNINQDVAKQVINTILAKCNIKALSLGQDLNLPPHLNLPRVSPVKNPQEYIG